MMVARQASLATSRGHFPPPKRAAQSSHRGGTTCVWRSTRIIGSDGWACGSSRGWAAQRWVPASLAFNPTYLFYHGGQAGGVGVPPGAELVGVLIGDGRLRFLHRRPEVRILHGLACRLAQKLEGGRRRAARREESRPQV